MKAKLLSIALTSSLVLFASTFHLDSINGNDDNDGLTPETAWKSLEMIAKADVKPGDAVLFRRGCLWRGGFSLRSGEPGNPVRFGNYGEGSLPIIQQSIDASDPKLWEEWKPGIWRTMPPKLVPVDIALPDFNADDWTTYNEAPASVKGVNRMEDGIKTFALSVAKVDKLARQIQIWGPRVPALAPVLRLTFRARANRPLNLPPLNVMYSASPWTVCNEGTMTSPLTAEWQTFTVNLRRIIQVEPQLPMKLHLRLGKALKKGDQLEIQLLKMEPKTREGGLELPVDVGNIIFDHGKKRCGWKKWEREQLENDGDFVFARDDYSVYLKYPANPGTLHSSVELPLRRHIVNHGNAHDVVVDGLAVRYGAAHGFGGANAHRITVRNCDVYYIGGGHQFTRDDNFHVRFGNGIEYWTSCSDILVENNRLWEIYDAALTPQGYGSKQAKSIERNLIFRNNVIWNCEYSFEYFNRYYDDAITENVLFENNTCINAGKGWGNWQRPNKNGGHLMFNHNSAQIKNFTLKNNIFYDTSLTCLRMNTIDWTHILKLENNLWGTSTPGTSIVKLANMKTPDKKPIPDLECGMDDFQNFVQQKNIGQSDIVGIPKFIDPENHDYRLAPDSPGYGRNIGANYKPDPGK